MYTCPQRVCYNSIAHRHLDGITPFRCSVNEGVIRDNKGSMYNFNVEMYKQQGYSKFKLLRSKGATGY